jgi:hypothetical protein
MTKHVGKGCKMAVLLVATKARTMPVQEATSFYGFENKFVGMMSITMGALLQIRGIVLICLQCQQQSRLITKQVDTIQTWVS